MAWFYAAAPLLPEILARHARSRPTAPALVYGDVSLDWQAFDAALNRVANALLDAGLRPGERVAILMDNGVEMALTMFGTMRAGLVAVPLNTSVADDALAAMIDDCAARALVVTAAHRARADECLARGTHDLPCRVCAADTTGPAGGGDWLAWTAWLEAADAAPPAVTVADEDDCNIIYSSGTTSLPKGIVHTHRRRLDWAFDLAIALRYHARAVTLCSLGLYSNISWVGLLCTWVAGGTVVVLPRFTPASALDAIARHRITHFSMVPVQYQRLLEDAAWSARDLRSLEAVMCCGSPLPAMLKSQLLTGLGCRFIELYGLTEGVITTLDPEDADGRIASVGRALTGTEIRIVGDDDRECATGEPGEIVGRGRILMSGYLNRDDASAEATWTDAQGQRWLRTGDIGRLDGDGFLYLVDRKKDMILSGGQNVYPADIEAVMLEHPAVAEVAVIGVPDARWGETPVAIVVARSVTDADGNTDAIRDWTNARVGRQQRIREVRFTEELPRNPNGKVLKRELRRTHAQMPH